MLVMADRERVGREASPSAAVIDSQSVKTTEAGGPRGAVPLLRASQPSSPFIELVIADSAYATERVASATSIAIEIVRKNPDQVGFTVQPRRWVVERFFASINRNRRLATDFEASIASARAFLYPASAMLLCRRIARLS